MPDLLPTLLAVAAAVLAAVAVEQLGRRRGEGPPGFDRPAPWAAVRRTVATALLAGVLFLGVVFPFTPAAHRARAALDLTAVAPWELFTLHLLLGATLLAWGALGYLGTGPAFRWTPEPGPALRLLRAFRLAEARPFQEIGVGLLAGVGIWAAVLFAVGGLAVLLQLLGLDRWLPSGPPALVSFIAAQPAGLRLLGSLSAGFFEETFFRGFLQPRVGVVLSTLLFVLAHWSYGEPFMLVGVTLLSLTYAALARWRGSAWAAITAHAVFDGVQLLVLVPLALEAVESGTVARLGAGLSAVLGTG